MKYIINKRIKASFYAYYFVYYIYEDTDRVHQFSRVNDALLR